MDASLLLDHYRMQACSRQWRGFLQAMADEFADALPDAELARLMARMGERFALAHPLAPADDLAVLQAACNGIWSNLDWGSAQFSEQPGEVTIEHLGAPLSALLGAGASWAGGFLEGVYRGWFQAAGMLPGLDVQHLPGTSADVSRYVLARVA